MRANKILMVAILFILVINISFVYAHGEETFAQAEEIIKQKTPCSELTENQLEILGDYYMEQMHPGEAHERMDEMMGGEGSESLRQMHINMGRVFYCGEHGAMSGETMNMIMGRMMPGNIMMDNYGVSSLCSSVGGIWCYWPSWSAVINLIFSLLVIIALILLIVWLVKKLQEEPKKIRTKRK